MTLSLNPHAPELAPGDIIAGKFRVEAIIGEGGMAFVMVATHLELDERVALKFIHSEFRKQEGVVSRFRAEARAVARMKGEHVARVMDVAATESGHPFIVMEYLDGEDLGHVIERRPLPARADAIGWIIEACEGLAEAHANGIVHRDVKPENLFLVERLGNQRIVKLLDFGISKLALTNGSSVSGQHVGLALIGTPSYMAPEQVRSAMNADPRSDQWSLGAVLFELLSGELPFVGDDVAEVCLNVLTSPHRPILSLVPDLEPALGAIIDRCLEKDPESRFPSVGDLALALMPYAHPRHRANVDRMIRLLSAAGLTDTQPISIPPPRPTEPPASLGSLSASRARNEAPTLFATPKARRALPIPWILAAVLSASILGAYAVLRFRSVGAAAPIAAPSISLTVLTPSLPATTITGAIAPSGTTSASRGTASKRKGPRKASGSEATEPPTPPARPPMEIKLER